MAIQLWASSKIRKHDPLCVLAVWNLEGFTSDCPAARVQTLVDSSLPESVGQAGCAPEGVNNAKSTSSQRVLLKTVNILSRMPL